MGRNTLIGYKKPFDDPVKRVNEEWREKNKEWVEKVLDKRDKKC